MRKLPLCLGVAMLLLTTSCKKSSSGGGSQPPSDYYLSAAISYAPQQQIIDAFYYDSLHRLDTFSQTIYDTTSGTPEYNVWMVQFLYQGNQTWPSWYNYYDVPLGGYGDYHLLSYDQENRITRDTSLSGSGYVTYFSYPGNNLAANTLFEGIPDDNLIDTLYMSGGNIGTEVIYLPNIPGQPDVLQGDVHFTNASAANPGYHEPIAGTFGPLMFNLGFNGYGNFVDFISRDAFKAVAGTEGSPAAPVSVNYTLASDSKGRLSKLTVTGGPIADSLVYKYY